MLNSYSTIYQNHISQPYTKVLCCQYTRRHFFKPDRNNNLLYVSLDDLSYPKEFQCRSHWPRGQRCGSAATRLLGLRVRIPPGAWMFVVSVVCCQVEVSASGWSLVQKSPTDCGASLRVWSRNFINKEALAHWEGEGLLPPKKRSFRGVPNRGCHQSDSIAVFVRRHDYRYSFFPNGITIFPSSIRPASKSTLIVPDNCLQIRT
jgi:hypothetical protein